MITIVELSVRRFFLALVLCFGPSFAYAQEARPGAHGLSLPASFQGRVALEETDRSADWHVALFPDQTFRLSRVFLNGGVETGTRSSLGRWRADASGGALILDDGAEMPLTVRANSRGDLRVIEANLDEVWDGVLEQDRSVQLPALAEMERAGMMTYLADAAVFEDCVSGLRMPIVMEGAYIDAERAYLQDGSGPGEPLLVRVTGTVEIRRDAERQRRESLVLSAFGGTRPGEVCEQAMPEIDLRDTYWRLDTLNGAAVPADVLRQEPYLVVETEGGFYRATVGCNRMKGTVVVGDDSTLSFGPTAATMMACPAPVDALERGYVQMLADVTAFELEGDALVLRDASGAVRATFTAVYV